MDNNDTSNPDIGLLMKQESVFAPTPMTPTGSKSLLTAPPMPDIAQNGNDPKAMKRNVSYGALTNQTEAKVLVLYTGELFEFLKYVEIIIF